MSQFIIIAPWLLNTPGKMIFKCSSQLIKIIIFLSLEYFKSLYLVCVIHSQKCGSLYTLKIWYSLSKAMILKCYHPKFSKICVFTFLTKMFAAFFIIKSTNANKTLLESLMTSCNTIILLCHITPRHREKVWYCMTIN